MKYITSHSTEICNTTHQYNITSKSTKIAVIECFVQCTILLVKLFHLIYAIAIKNAKDSCHF